jgi:hypothetical protein
MAARRAQCILATASCIATPELSNPRRPAGRPCSCGAGANLRQVDSSSRHPANSCSTSASADGTHSRASGREVVLVWREPGEDPVARGGEPGRRRTTGPCQLVRRASAGLGARCCGHPACRSCRLGYLLTAIWRAARRRSWRRCTSRGGYSVRTCPTVLLFAALYAKANPTSYTGNPPRAWKESYLVLDDCLSRPEGSSTVKLAGTLPSPSCLLSGAGIGLIVESIFVAVIIRRLFRD